LIQNQRDPHISNLESRARYSNAKRGNLRLFFGGSAGFTAVRTMLETAKVAQQTGVDVVVGLVNSCGHSVIDRLLCGFECLPALHGSNDAKRSGGIDLDAVRKREPAILLVDTRVPPSSQTDRGPRSITNYGSWADIEDVIASGINVWAALDATGFSSWASLGMGVPRRVSGLSLL
jgi:two-component system sensor histidine kinase KdpD